MSHYNSPDRFTWKRNGSQPGSYDYWCDNEPVAMVLKVRDSELCVWQLNQYPICYGECNSLLEAQKTVENAVDWYLIESGTQPHYYELTPYEYKSLYELQFVKDTSAWPDNWNTFRGCRAISDRVYIVEVNTKSDQYMTIYGYSNLFSTRNTEQTYIGCIETIPGYQYESGKYKRRARVAPGLGLPELQEFEIAQFPFNLGDTKAYNYLIERAEQAHKEHKW